MISQLKPNAEAQLAKIGQSHSTNGGLNVDPGLYEYWIDSLVQAVSEMDPKFTPEVENIWRRVMQKGVAFLISK